MIQGCPYSCPPEARQGLCQWCEGGESSSVSRQVRIVDLPVGATEDRLVGSLDIELAIKTGTRSFEPGLIAATHRGILYIDEVNLLSDHLVDVLLDAAAMGRNYVEREGISISHAADFILVGTMNPEEGDLRPQLLDRFGLAVEVEGTMAAEDRREVVRRRISYEADPFQFMGRRSGGRPDGVAPPPAPPALPATAAPHRTARFLNRRLSERSTAKSDCGFPPKSSNNTATPT